MLKKLFYLLFSVIAIQLSASDIVKNGQPVAEIVIPAKPNHVERYAAEELKYHLKLVSGATLKVVYENKLGKDVRYRFYIGATQKAAQNKVVVSDLKYGSFKIQSVENGIVLIGKDKVEWRYQRNGGSIYAVHEWLRTVLGIRWAYPGEDGIYFNPTKNIASVSLKKQWEPRFLTQGAGRIFRADHTWYRRTLRPTGEPQDWYRYGHAFMDWRKKYYKTNPEWFAHSPGNPKFGSPSMNVSNEGFQNEIVRQWAEKCKKDNKKYILNTIENDFYGQCECADCLKADGPDIRFSFMPNFKNVGTRYAKFYLETWKKAAKIDPSVQSWGYAYTNYFYAPHGVKLNKQITVNLVPPTNYVTFPYPEKEKAEIFRELRGWAKSGATLGYRPNIYNGYVMPENTARDFYEEFMIIRDSVKHIGIDGPNVSFAMQGPMLYVMGGLMINPEASLDELQNEYYSCFGTAAPAVKKYWEYWDKYTHDNADFFRKTACKKVLRRWIPTYDWFMAYYAHIIFPEKVFAPAFKYLDEAEALAKNSPRDLKKVQFLRAGLEHALLCVKACALFDGGRNVPDEKKAEAAGKVYEYRRTKLPPFAADLFVAKQGAFNESTAWKYTSFNHQSAFVFPFAWKFKKDQDGKGMSLGYSTVSFNDKDWQIVQANVFLDKQGIKDTHAAWYRSTLEIPKQFRGKETHLVLGGISGTCQIYVNGKEAGQVTAAMGESGDAGQEAQKFNITKFLSANGKNTFAIYFKSSSGKGGLCNITRLEFTTGKK